MEDPHPKCKQRPMKSKVVVGVALGVGLAFFFLAPVYQVSFHNPPFCNHGVYYCGAVTPPFIFKSLSCVVGVRAGVIYAPVGLTPIPRYHVGRYDLTCSL